MTATGLDAERLGDDLACLSRRTTRRGRTAGRRRVSSGPVAVLPAWETLPFERVSPETETMGRRLAVLHVPDRRASTPSLPAAAPGDRRARCAPCCSGSDRSQAHGAHRGAPGRPGRPRRRCCPTWWPRATGASTRSSTAASSPCAAASSTSSPPRRTYRCASTCGATRSTASTAFSVSDQRSSHDLEAVVLYGCRELVTTPRAARRGRVARWPGGPGGPRRGSAWPAASSSTAWSRGCRSSTPSERVLPDLLPAGGAGRPRRAAPDQGPGRRSCSTRRRRWPRRWRPPGGPRRGRRSSFPRLHVPFERLLRDCPAGVTALPPVPEGPSVAALTVRRFDPVAGDPARLAAGVARLVGEGYAVTLCAATAAGAGAPGGDPGRARACTLRCVDAAPGDAGRRRRGGARHERLHPPRRQGGGALGDRRHGAPDAAPAGPARGPGRRTGSSTTSRRGASSSTASTAWPASRA